MKYFIQKYDITLKLVEEEDAAFIVNIRTDVKRKRFISATNVDLDLQKDWIRNYKERELQEKEYYFIAIDNNNEKFATYRIYNMGIDTVEIGSWVTKPDYSLFLNSIKVDLILKDFVFNTLRFNKLKFEVRKENTSVVKYHNLFNPTLVRESEVDLYYELDRDSFEIARCKLFKNLR